MNSDTLLPLNEGWSLLDGLVAEAERERARVDAYLAEHPPSGSIERPVLIVGQYRTGTTYLHRMLAADPGFRTLLGWEVQIPTPPPARCERYTDPRAAEHQQVVDVLWSLDAELALMHEEPARAAAECVRAFAQSGVTGLWPAIAPCPAYVDWLLSSDAQEPARAAYERHDTCLRLLQGDEPPEIGWLLKAPMHSLFLDQIAEVWPDARLIMVQRHENNVVSSVVRFFSHLRALSKGTPDDHAEEVRSWVRPYLREHVVRVRASDLDTFVVDCPELRHRPEAVAHDIRHWLEA